MNTTQKRSAVFIIGAALIGTASTVPAVSFAALIPVAFGIYSYLKADKR